MHFQSRPGRAPKDEASQECELMVKTPPSDGQQKLHTTEQDLKRLSAVEVLKYHVYKYYLNILRNKREK